MTKEALSNFREDPTKEGEVSVTFFAPPSMSLQSERVVRAHCNYLGLIHSLKQEPDGARIKFSLTASGRGRELVMLVDDVTAWIEANAVAGY